MAKPTSSPRSRWATRSKKWRRRALRCAAIGALLGGSVHAQSTTWSGAFINGTWSDPSRWTNGVPTSLVDAIMPATSSFNISFTADAHASDLYLSSNSLVNLLLGTHTLNASTLSVAASTTGNAILFQQGGTLNVSGDGLFGVGTTASAYAQISGGVMAIGGDALIGDLGGIGNLVVTTASFDAGSVELGAAGGSGTIALFNGANLLVANDANIGASVSGIAGSGTLSVSSGAAGTVSGTTKVWSGGTMIVSGGSFTTQSLDLSSAGGFAFTSGTVTVSGGSMSPRLGTVPVTYANSTIVNETNSFEINGSASTFSSLKLTGGATLSSAANNLFVGHAGKQGMLVVDGNSVLDFTAGTLSVGMSAPATVSSVGTLMVTNHGSVFTENNLISIGRDGGHGTAVVDGLFSLLSSGSDLDVGTEGYVSGSNFVRSNGTLQITNGGEAYSSSGMNFGLFGGLATINVSGQNSTLQTGDGIDIGDSTAQVGGTENRSSGTVNISGGAQASAKYWVTIGADGGSGFVSVDGANSQLVNSFLDFYLGYGVGFQNAATGTLALTSGGLANSAGGAYVGIIGGKGTISVNNALLNIADELEVGAATSGTFVSAGTVSITNGGTATSNSAIIGMYGALGTVSLSGTGSSWDNTATLLIGNDGTGGTSANGTGSLILSNNATLSNGGLIKVYSGGHMIVSSGASVITHNLDISSAAQANFTGGTVTVNGGQFVPNLTTITVFAAPTATTYTNAFQFDGNSSTSATLTLSGGATLSSTASQCFIGHSGMFAALNIDGAGTHWNLPDSALAMGTGRNSGDTVSGQGTLTITNGGWVSDFGNTWIGWHGGLGAATVDGPGSKLDTTNALLGIGESGFADSDGTDFPRSHGTLILSNGGEASSHTITRIGDQAGIGYVSVNNATLNVGQTIYVGIGQDGATTLLPGTGTLVVATGGDVNSAGGAIGSGSGVGTVNLSGTGSTWTNTIDLNIGNDSTGSAAGTGTVALSNNAALNNTGTIKVFSGGKLFVSTGATLTTSTLNLSSAGSFAFSDGTVSTGTLITTGNLAKFGWTGGTLDITNSNLTIGTVSASTAGPVGTFLTLGTGKNLRVSKVGSTLTVPSSGSLNVTGGSLYARSLDVSNASTFTFTGGMITVDGGAFTPKLGTVSVYQSPAVANYSNSFDVSGPAGTAPLLNFVGSASISTSAYAFVIGDSGNIGTVVVDGVNSQLNLPNNFWVGYGRNATGANAAQGTLEISNGGQVVITTVSDDPIVGMSGGEGWATVDGSTSKLSSSENLYVGYGFFDSGSVIYPSEGTLTIFNGGRMSALNMLDGEFAGRGNIVLMGGILSLNYSLLVGDGDYFAYSTEYPSQGVLNLSGGGSVTSNDARIGSNHGSGTIFLGGAGSAWANATSLNIGNSGSGNPLANGRGTLIIASSAALINGGVLNVWSGGTILYNGGTLSTATLIVSGGHVLLGPGHDKVLQTKAVSISSGGVVDLNDNSMIVDYTGGSPLTNIESLIQSGYASGLWNGSGIVSSAAAMAPTKMALGFGEASTVFGPSGGTFQGVPVDSSTVLVKYTYAGDANLDGQVNLQDLLALAQHWGQSDGLWTEGDFNYDGIVDVADLVLLARNWQAGVGSPLAPSLAPLLASLNLPDINVPEPSSIGCFGAVFFGILSCRRRCPLVVGRR